MLGEAGHGGECLATVLALDLLAAVGVHAFVSAEVGELGVGLEAHFTLKRLDRAAMANKGITLVICQCLYQLKLCLYQVKLSSFLN